MFRPYRCAAVVAVVCMIGWAVPVRAQDSREKAALELDSKVMADATKTSEIIKNLSYLSDVIGPRLTGSANLKRANEWGAEIMKKYGLQNVKLEPWEMPVGWERGTATMKLIDPDNGRSLTVCAAGWTGSTKGKVVSDVVVVNARTKEDLEKYKGKLKNAVVLRGEPSKIPTVLEWADRLVNPKKAEDKKPDEKKFAGRQGRFGDQTFQRELAEFYRMEGVAVVLRDSGKPHNLLVTTGNWRTQQGGDRGNTQEPMPSLFIAHEHYALLHRLATRPEPAKTKVEVEVTNKFIPGPITVYNTVGEIPGEKADEFVVVGAHLDSWDLAQGTTDNGTGSCVVLETARLLVRSGVKPKRTIRFVLFTGEEQGLHGSKQYVIRHKDEMPKTSAALVHDTGTGKVLGFGLQGREAIKPIMDRELVSLKNIGFTGVTLRYLTGTDHQSFDGEFTTATGEKVNVNVPGFACAQFGDEYFLTHHTQSDTLDKAKEPDLIQGAQVMAVSAMRIANLDNLLPRERPKKTFGRSKEDTPNEGEAKKDPPKPEPLAIVPRVVK